MTGPLTRQRLDMALFLGPACLLLAFFFLAPVIVNVVLAFTDMGRNLRITQAHDRELRADADGRSPPARCAGRHRHLRAGHARDLQSSPSGSCSRWSPPRCPTGAGAFFRAVWLLPRMSPSVVYALLWGWVVAPTDYGLLNQTLGAFGLPPIDMKSDAPVVLIILANGFIGASFGMIIFTSAIRAIPQHLFWAARVDGASGLAIVRHITLPAIRWQISFVTIYQALSLLVSFEYIWLITDGGPVLRHHRLRALRLPARASTAASTPTARRWRSCSSLIGIAAALLWRFYGHARAAAAPRIEVHMSTAVLPLEPRAGRLGGAGGAGALPAPAVDRACSTPSSCARLAADARALSLAGHRRLLRSDRAPSTFVLWRTLAVLLPALVLVSIVGLVVVPTSAGGAAASVSIGAVTVLILAIVTGPHLHLDNWRFLWNPDVADALKGASGVGGQVPERLDGLLQLAPDRRRADGARRRRRHARRLLPLPLCHSPAAPCSCRAARPARLPGDDADHSDLPDDVLDRAAGHARGRHPGPHRARAAVRDLRHEGLLRRRALGHRDERDDRRRVAAAGLPPWWCCRR